MKKPMHVENEFLSRRDKLNWNGARNGWAVSAPPAIAGRRKKENQLSRSEPRDGNGCFLNITQCKEERC